jgi:DNA-binding NtrC family response regulator
LSDSATISVLIVEDEENLRSVLRKELSRLGHETHIASNGAEALAVLENTPCEVVLADINMPQMDGLEMLRQAKTKPATPEIIMLTGHATIESAIEAMKLGAYDYLSKPYRLAELDALVRQAADKFRLRHTNQRLRRDNQRLRQQINRQAGQPEIIAVSPAMKEVLRFIEKVGPTDTSVLLTGESGTGKEVIAQALHQASPRAHRAFIDINCAAFQENLLESELFGHEAGAFSGAKNRKLGLFELADGGTLFLDEVTEMPPPLQAKLLRALETRSFYRVGGTRKVEVNVRLVSATNRSPEQAIADKLLRADLLYRLNGFQIDLKPLRQRPEDVIPLVRYLLEQMANGAELEIAPEVFPALISYPWPGNVRQLRNYLERAWLLAENNRITLAGLPPEVLNLPLAPQYQPATIPKPAPVVANVPLRQAEKQQILMALEETNWHRGQAAALLGISPSTLYRRLQAYGLDVKP